MDYKKNTLICFSFFIIVLSALLLVNGIERRSDKDEIQIDKRLITHPIQEISAIAIIRDDYRFGVIHQAQEIRLEPPIDGEILSQQELQAFIYEISQLSFIGKYERQKPLDDYGLDPPQSQITVFINTGDKVRFLLGNKNSLNDGYYLMIEGEDNLYLITESSGVLFFKTPMDFRDRRVLPEFDMDDINLIKEISLVFPSDDRAAFIIKNRGSLNFELSHPIKNSVDFEMVLSGLIFPLMNLNPDHRYKADEIQEQFNSEKLIVSLKIDNKKNKFIFYETSEGNPFLKIGDNPDYFSLSGNQFPIDSVDYLQFLDGSIYHCNISELSSIQLRDLENNKDYSLELSGLSVKMTASLNGADLSYQALMDLYNQLVETGLAERIDLPTEKTPADRDSAFFTITLYKKDGTIDLLEYYLADRDECFLAVNGVINFTTYIRSIQEIRRSLNEILED